MDPFNESKLKLKKENSMKKNIYDGGIGYEEDEDDEEEEEEDEKDDDDDDDEYDGDVYGGFDGGDGEKLDVALYEDTGNMRLCDDDAEEYFADGAVANDEEEDNEDGGKAKGSKVEGRRGDQLRSLANSLDNSSLNHLPGSSCLDRKSSSLKVSRGGEGGRGKGRGGKGGEGGGGGGGKGGEGGGGGGGGGGEGGGGGGGGAGGAGGGGGGGREGEKSGKKDAGKEEGGLRKQGSRVGLSEDVG